MDGLVGLQAIEAHNGWSIAILGITIVFTGLTLLSLTISQLHKVLDIWENRGKKPAIEKTSQPQAKPAIVLPEDIREIARLYKMLIEHMGEHPFALPKLLDYAVERGLASPYSSLNDLLLAEVIIPEGDGYFLWNEDVSSLNIKPKKEE